MPVDSWHRTLAFVMARTGERDAGKAEAHLRALRVQLCLGTDVAASPALQAAALTIVNAGTRTFLGGVSVSGAAAGPSLTALTTEATFVDALQRVGAQSVDALLPDVPTIVVGTDAVHPSAAPVTLRVELAGWNVVVRAVEEPAILADAAALPIAGVFGGALALSEVFAAAFGLHPEAGHRSTGLSLWSPDPRQDLRHLPQGPAVSALPSHVWVVGLGHLGQGYLWSLAALGYRDPAALEIILQDVDVIGPESHSTGLLIEAGSTGQAKARVADAWLRARGFRTRLVERWFDDDTRFHRTDASILLAGVDSPAARLAIAGTAEASRGVLKVLDVGIGALVSDIDGLTLQRSPFSSAVLTNWRSAGDRRAKRAAAQAASALSLEVGTANHLDPCGIMRFAETAVGVPFVGAAAGALVAAELLRELAGEAPIDHWSAQLRDVARGRSAQKLGAPNTAMAWVAAR